MPSEAGPPGQRASVGEALCMCCHLSCGYSSSHSTVRVTLSGLPILQPGRLSGGVARVAYCPTASPPPRTTASRWPARLPGGSAPGPVAWLLLLRRRRRRRRPPRLRRVPIRRRRAVWPRHHVAVRPRLAAIRAAGGAHLWCPAVRLRRVTVRSRRRLRGVGAAVRRRHPVRALWGHAPPGRAAGVRALRRHAVLTRAGQRQRCQQRRSGRERETFLPGGSRCRCSRRRRRGGCTPSDASRCCEWHCGTGRCGGGARR